MITTTGIHIGHLYLQLLPVVKSLQNVVVRNVAALETVNVLKIVSEYDQEIPQSQTADNHMAPRGRAAQPSRDTRKTN